MAKVTKYPQGTISWVDARSTDAEVDKTFYKAVFGWETTNIPIGDGQVYTLFTKNGENVAGLEQLPREQQENTNSSYWIVYIAVDDVDKITTKAEHLGGNILVHPVDVFDNGRMSLIVEPSGTTVGFWQAKNHIGASLINEDGALIWNELTTWKSADGMEFFGKLLGWKFKQLEEYETGYWLFFNNERTSGGVLQMTEDWKGMSSHWMNYFHVDQLDSTLEKIILNDGTLIHGPIDESIGKIVIVSSPTGLQFSIIQMLNIDEWIE